MRKTMVAAVVLGVVAGTAAEVGAAPRPIADRRIVWLFRPDAESNGTSVSLDSGRTEGADTIISRFVLVEDWNGPLENRSISTKFRRRRDRGEVVTYYGKRDSKVGFLIVRARFEGETLVRFGTRHRPPRDGSPQVLLARTTLDDVVRVQILPEE